MEGRGVGGAFSLPQNHRFWWVRGEGVPLRFRKYCGPIPGNRAVFLLIVSLAYLGLIHRKLGEDFCVDEKGVTKYFLLEGLTRVFHSTKDEGMRKAKPQEPGSV